MKGTFNARSGGQAQETNTTLEDIRKIKERYAKSRSMLWRSTKAAILFPSYMKHQTRMRYERHKNRAFQAYVKPFIEECKSRHPFDISGECINTLCDIAKVEIESLAVREMQHNLTMGDHNAVLMNLCEDSGSSDFSSWSSLMEQYRQQQAWQWETPTDQRRRLRKIELDLERKRTLKAVAMARREGLSCFKKQSQELKHKIKDRKYVHHNFVCLNSTSSNRCSFGFPSPWELEKRRTNARMALLAQEEAPCSDDDGNHDTYDPHAILIKEEQHRQFLQDIQAQITVIYKKHDPSKVAKLPKLIARCEVSFLWQIGKYMSNKCLLPGIVCSCEV